MTNEHIVKKLSATGQFTVPILATAPASPSNGDIYYDTVGLVFKFRQNGAWIPLGSGGANVTLSNLGTTAINASLFVDTDSTYDIGVYNKAFNNIYARIFTATNGTAGRIQLVGTATTTPSGASVEGSIQGLFQSGSLGLWTPNNGANSGGVYIESGGTDTGVSGPVQMRSGDADVSGSTGNAMIGTGNATAGAGGSGDIIALIGTSFGGTRGKIRLKDGSEGTIGQIWTSTDITGAGQWSPAPVSGPAWTKYTFSHTAFQTAALTNSITLFSLPAKTMIHNIAIKHSTSFAGPGIVSYTISAGIVGNTTKYASAFDVFSAVASSNFQTSADNQAEDFSSSTTIQLTATSTGANLSASNAGSVDVWVQTSALP